MLVQKIIIVGSVLGSLHFHSKYIKHSKPYHFADNTIILQSNAPLTDLCG